MGEYLNRLCTCVMERTVAPTTQGSPSREWTKMRIPTISMSKWYPEPFCRRGRARGGEGGGRDEGRKEGRKEGREGMVGLTQYKSDQASAKT